jgi:dTDP-4-dehydrorhamnose 3,5-epimerase
MEIIETLIADLKLVRSREYEDSRGTFSRSYCMRDFEILIGSRTLKQINLSLTHKIGAIRGLHLQLPPHSELKLVRCLKGTVWDVAVDLRQGSSTFLQWHAEELSEKNKRVLVIPEGFAHGFQVMASGSQLLYMHTNFYAPDFETGFRYDDPLLDISWPLTPSDISERDQSHSLIDQNFKGINIELP